MEDLTYCTNNKLVGTNSKFEGTGWAGAQTVSSSDRNETALLYQWTLFPFVLHCINWIDVDDLSVDHYAGFLTFHTGYFWCCFRHHQEEWNNGTWMLNIFCSVLHRKSLACFSIGDALTSLLT